MLRIRPVIVLRPLLSGRRSQSTKDVTAPEDWIISPEDLEEKHVSHMYCVSSEDVKAAAFSTSLPRSFSTQTAAVDEVCWLLRRPSFQILRKLREYDSTQPQNFRYLLYGADGVGKTICLHQILHYCLKSGWLLIFIPGVFSWTHSSWELRPSARVPGMFDQPEAATGWLKTFRALNSHFTAQLKLSRDWEWGKKDHSLAGEEVNKVIDMALVKPVLATDVVEAVLQELVQARDKLKMILAVDEFNGCFSPTTLRNQQNQWVPAHQLSLVQSLLHHIPEFPGALLLSLSRSRMLRRQATHWAPNDLLDGGDVPVEMRSKSQAILQSCEAVEVAPYTRQEMERALQYYHQRRWINTDLTAAVMEELWYLTSGNPRTLYRMCASL